MNNRVLATFLLSALLALAGCSRAPDGSARFNDVREAAAERLGGTMASVLKDTGPVLLVHRDASEKTLVSVEKGLKATLGPGRVIIRVCNPTTDPIASTMPDAASIGLLDALQQHPDTAGVVCMNSLHNLPAEAAKWPPMFAFDWAGFELSKFSGHFTAGIFKGGVFQKVSAKPVTPEMSAQAAFDAAYDLVTPANLLEILKQSST